VSIGLVEKLKHPDGTECWGIWDDSTRTILLDKSANRRHQWRVLYHELAHVALSDAGLDNGIGDELVEAICDAVATARMRERFG
jgi:Zn-dependent peptidase ImmA (M78 family)